jgi:uncharacterized protein DUF4956
MSLPLVSAVTVVGPSYPRLLARLLLDVVALAAAIYVLYFRRHGRRDLFMALACFNLGLFAVLSVITVEHFGAAFGFGLFAILSIIRLRSEALSNQEVGYFFIALVLGLINGIDTGQVGYTVLLDAIVLAGVYFADHPDLLTPVYKRRLTLDQVYADEEEIRANLRERLGLDVREVEILEADYVRDITRVDIRYVGRPPIKPLADDAEEELLDELRSG